MIKLTQKTLNLFDLLIRHSFHYWIWTFCALFLIFDKILHMPLELLNHFNFIPDFIINLSKILNTKSIETTIPEITVLPSNNEELIAVIKDSFSLLHQDISLLSNKIDSLNILFEKNTVLLQKQLSFHKGLFQMVEQKLTYLNTSNDLLKINYKLQDLSAIMQAQVESQVEIGSRIISHIKDMKTSILTLNSSALDINKNILSIDINKPLLGVQDLLNQVVINQKDLQTLYQSTQNINLQSLNSILEMQNQGFLAMEENLKEIFSKVHEVRNHNLSLHQQLIKNIDVKLLEQQTEIVNQVIDELNRPKTSSTEVSSNTSKFGFFNKK